MAKLKAYSLLLDEVVDVGLPSDSPDLYDLGEFMATGRDSIIVFVDGKLPPWRDGDE